MHQQSGKMGFQDFYILMMDFASMMSTSPSLPLLKCRVRADLSISPVGHMYAGNAPPAAPGRLTLAQYLKNKTARADRFGPAPAGWKPVCRRWEVVAVGNALRREIRGTMWWSSMRKVDLLVFFFYFVNRWGVLLSLLPPDQTECNLRQSPPFLFLRVLNNPGQSQTTT